MTTPGEDNYELFAPGDCNQPLPLNRIVGKFRFSRFIGISQELDNQSAAKLVLSRFVGHPN